MKNTSILKTRYITDPFYSFAPLDFAEDPCREWYETAIELDAYRTSDIPEFRAMADHVFAEIHDSLKVRSSEKRQKQVLKMVLVNLYVAFLQDAPIFYSRNKNDYARDKRYGLLFFKYDRLLDVISALENHGYVAQAKGFWVSSKNLGKQTRMWPTLKLRHLFIGLPINRRNKVEHAERTEIIELRDEKRNEKNKKIKKSVSYKETSNIELMRTQINKYNNFIEKQVVEVIVGGEVEIRIQGLRDRIYSASIAGYISIREVRVATYLPTMTNTCACISNEINALGIVKERRLYDFEPVRIESSATTDNEYRHQVMLSRIIKLHESLNGLGTAPDDTRKQSLFHFGLRGLAFVINHKKLHRVFNQESFDLGGRFYGAYHEMMPKTFRPYIRINGKPTVELDFAAHHIRMAYHLKNIDYQGDPYMDLCAGTNSEERKMYKLLSLMVINCSSEIETIKAFRNKAREEEFNIILTDISLRTFLTRFKEVHYRITEYVHSGAGSALQNIDSRITNNILIRLTEAGIPCLPVHDSYIVPAQHESQLKEAMTNEYRTTMKFDPVLVPPRGKSPASESSALIKLESMVDSGSIGDENYE